MENFDEELDVVGLNCPLPIIKARSMLKRMKIGQVLRILASDPGAVKDFESFAKQVGHELLKSTEEDGVFIFFIEKKE